MQIAMADAGIVQLRDEFPQGVGQELADARTSRGRESRQGRFNEMAQRLGIFQAPGDEVAIARPGPQPPFPECQRNDRWYPAGRNSEGPDEFRTGLCRPNELAQPGSYI